MMVEEQNNSGMDNQPTEQQVAADTTATTVETPTAEAPVEAETQEENVAHDDFNWEAGNTKEPERNDDENAELEKKYASTFREISENEIVSGKIEAITDSDVVLDVGYKSDGLVSLSEFRDTPDIAVNDQVEVYVVDKEDPRGQLVLSRKKAKLLRAWDAIVDAYDTEKIVRGTITRKTKGGMMTDVFGLDAFLPGSQIDVRPIPDYDAYVGKTMEFKVVKINDQIKNVVISHKALIESDLEEQRQKIIAQLEKGQVLAGTVKNLTDFGAFIDLGGVDGLLYITDISWGRISHPKDVLELNQELNVVVIDFDEDRKRISLGLKQLTPHPWEVLSEDVSEGAEIEGTIVNIEDYGAFLEVMPGVEGLIHVSEVSWSNQQINPREFFTVGEKRSAKIVTLDTEERKMSLSIKQLEKDPWDTIEEKFPIGSRHTGEVKNITPYGVFIEMSDGIGGMIHISDLSWTKRFNHPSEYTRPGEELDVIILGIDKEARKLSLGHKQIEEDPWDTFATVFPTGSVHEGTIIRRDDKGGIVALPYGLEAFAPNRQLTKEDNTSAQLDEVLDFEILEFNRDEKRIVVSHSETYLKDRRAAEHAERRAKKEQRNESNKKVKELQKRVQSDRTTFGDLGVLSQLKAKMQSDEQDASANKVAEPLGKEVSLAEEMKDQGSDITEFTNSEAELAQTEENIKNASPEADNNTSALDNAADIAEQANAMVEDSGSTETESVQVAQNDTEVEEVETTNEMDTKSDDDKDTEVADTNEADSKADDSDSEDDDDKSLLEIAAEKAAELAEKAVELITGDDNDDDDDEAKKDGDDSKDA